MQRVIACAASMAMWITLCFVLEVWSSNPGPAKSYTALQTACHSYTNSAGSSCITLICAMPQKWALSHSVHA